MINHQQPSISDDPLLTFEEACIHRNFCMKIDNDTNSPTYGQKVPDVEGFKRILRKTDKLQPVIRSGVEDGRNRLIRQYDLDKFIDEQIDTVNKPNHLTGENPDIAETVADIAKTEEDITLINKQREKHSKLVELNALKAGFKTAEEYEQALNELSIKENNLKQMEIKLKDFEETLRVREMSIADKEATIEQVCNAKLTEAESTCNKMIEDTKKRCEQMVANKKVEIRKQENSEFDNMEQAVHEFEVINSIIYNWGFYDFGEQIDITINRIIEALNNNATLQDLWEDYKYATDLVCEVMAITQNRKDANLFIDFRNQLGNQAKMIIVKLHLDDNRMQPKTTLRVD